MKAKVFLFLFIILFSSSTFAATKQDIIDYAASQEVCDSKTSAIFNTYRNTFTRLVRQKKLTESQCNQIMEYLKNSVGILNSKGVCSLSDLNKLTSAEKDKIYNSLSAGANIIIKAPTEGFDSEDKQNVTAGNNKVEQNNKVELNNKEEGTSGININKTDGTIDIYENGVLLDKVEMTQEKLTYTGPNIMNIYIVIGIIIFILAFGIYIFIYPRHTRKLRFYKNILVSIQIMSCFVVLGIFIIRPKIYTLGNVVEMLSLQTTDNQKEVIVTEEKNIIYPSYGYVYGKIISDKLDINVKVAFGDSTEILSENAGTASWSSLPTEGKNIVISAHNSDNMFGNLKNINIGDKFVLDTNYAKCVYTVYDTAVIEDTEVDKVKIDKDKETLCLYTCYPFSNYIYSNKRFVVYSELESVEWK